MLKKLFDTMANMGIWIRLNDSRTEPPSQEGRIWGLAVQGFSISLAPLNEGSVSVLIRNQSGLEKRVQLPGWLKYLQITFVGPAGAPVPLKPYGAQLLESPQISRPVERNFQPGKPLVTEIPYAALFDLEQSGTYRLKVAALVPGQPELTLVSNELLLLVHPRSTGDR